MSKIPLPERGQPIDVSYVYQLANAINQLSDQLSTTGYNYTTVDTPSAGKQNIKTSEARIIAGQKVVTSNTSQGADTTAKFDFPYNNNFRYTPIATATVVNNSKTDAGSGATVVITDIDANGLSGLVRFDKAGTASITVNLIVIGIPN